MNAKCCYQDVARLRRAAARGLRAAERRQQRGGPGDG